MERRSLKRESYRVIDGLVLATCGEDKICCGIMPEEKQVFWAGLQKRIIFEASSQWLGTARRRESPSFPNMKGEMPAPAYISVSVLLNQGPERGSMKRVSGAGAGAGSMHLLEYFVLRPKFWYRTEGRAPKMCAKKVVCDPSLLPKGKDLLRNVRTLVSNSSQKIQRYCY